MRTRTSSSNPSTSVMRSAYKSSESIVAQKRAYCAPCSWSLRRRSLATGSGNSSFRGFAGARTEGGMRWSARENCGEGKHVKALTRMLVMTSSLTRSGLSWYLNFSVSWLFPPKERYASSIKTKTTQVGSDRANIHDFKTAGLIRPRTAQVIGNVYT